MDAELRDLLFAYALGHDEPAAAAEHLRTLLAAHPERLATAYEVLAEVASMEAAITPGHDPGRCAARLEAVLRDVMDALAAADAPVTAGRPRSRIAWVPRVALAAGALLALGLGWWFLGRRAEAPRPLVAVQVEVVSNRTLGAETRPVPPDRLVDVEATDTLRLRVPLPTDAPHVALLWSSEAGVGVLRADLTDGLETILAGRPWSASLGPPGATVTAAREGIEVTVPVRVLRTSPGGVRVRVASGAEPVSDADVDGLLRLDTTAGERHLSRTVTLQVAR